MDQDEGKVFFEDGESISQTEIEPAETINEEMVGDNSVEFTPDDNPFDNLGLGARLKVIGIGGGGCKPIEGLIKSNVQNIELIALNTDCKNLRTLQRQAGSYPNIKLGQLGPKTTRGLGAGSMPEMGAKAANESESEIRKLVQDCDMVFITAGLGGGTGTGASPIVARIAKEMGILTVGVATLPFFHEGKRKWNVAIEGMEKLRDEVDSLILIPNEKIVKVYGQAALTEGFKHSDQILIDAVYGISELINAEGSYHGVDFADVRTCLMDKGLAVISVGYAKSSPRCAQEAIESALENPMLEDCDIRGAMSILGNIISNQNLKMNDVGIINSTISDLADEDAITKIGTIVDNEMDDGVRIILVASGVTVSGFEYKKPEAAKENSNIHSLSRPFTYKGKETIESNTAPEVKAEPPKQQEPAEQPANSYYKADKELTKESTLASQPPRITPNTIARQKGLHQEEKKAEDETDIHAPAFSRPRKYTNLAKFARFGQWQD